MHLCSDRCRLCMREGYSAQTGCRLCYEGGVLCADRVPAVLCGDAPLRRQHAGCVVLVLLCAASMREGQQRCADSTASMRERDIPMRRQHGRHAGEPDILLRRQHGRHAGEVYIPSLLPWLPASGPSYPPIYSPGIHQDGPGVAPSRCHRHGGIDVQSVGHWGSNNEKELGRGAWSAPLRKQLSACAAVVVRMSQH